MTEFEFKLPRWEQLPSIDLYLEQVQGFIDNWLGEALSNEGKSVLTKTMVNNYVKQKFIEAPCNKKYDRRAIACLIVIAILKPVYSINEVNKLINLAIKTDNIQDSYDRFCDKIEGAVKDAFSGSSMIKEKDADDPRSILWNVAISFACQLYTRKIYLDKIGR